MTNEEIEIQKALALIQPRTILDQGEFHFYDVTENGIAFRPSTPFEVWEKATRSLTEIYETSGKLHFRAMCALGDALNFGEKTYGEEHTQAIDTTRKFMQLSAKTLMNVCSIMSSVPPENRHYNLTLSHHDAVAALENKEQVELLDKAEAENWTVAALKKEVKERHPKPGSTRGGNKAIIDLESEEGLQHAAEKVLEWFQNYEAPLKDARTKKDKLDAAGKKALPPLLKEWPKSRKDKWMALTGLAQVARRMGIAGFGTKK